MNEQLAEVLRRMPTDEEMREVRILLANRRAYVAATSALKNAALWVVAIAAAFTVLQGGFVASLPGRCWWHRSSQPASWRQTARRRFG